MTNYVKVKFTYFCEIEKREKIESMWASIFGKYYRIENTPFYVLNYALGDIIETQIIDNDLFVKKLIKASGNSTIHIIFYDENIVQKTRDALRSMGCSSELSNISSLISLNIPANIDYINKIKPYLVDGEVNELWSYQEACLAQ